MLNADSLRIGTDRSRSETLVEQQRQRVHDVLSMLATRHGIEDRRRFALDLARILEQLTDTGFESELRSTRSRELWDAGVRRIAIGQLVLAETEHIHERVLVTAAQRFPEFVPEAPTTEQPDFQEPIEPTVPTEIIEPPVSPPSGELVPLFRHTEPKAEQLRGATI